MRWLDRGNQTIKDARMLKKVLLAICPILALSLGAARVGHADPAATKADKAAPSPTKGAMKADKPAPPAAGEATLTGDMTCAKCGLHESTTCQNVLVVKEAGGAGGKEAKYYLAKNAVAQENHQKICGGSAHATVTGKVSEEGGKKIITPSTVKFD